MSNRSVEMLLTACILFYQLNSFASGVSVRETPTAFRIALDELVQINKLANGLILSEAVVEGAINVSSLAIDFMIMGHMPKKAGWIEKVATQEVENNMTQKFKELYEKFQPLKDVLANGRNWSIELENISKMIELIGNYSKVEKIRTDVQKIEEFVQGFISYIDEISVGKERIEEFMKTVTFVGNLIITSNTDQLFNSIELVLDWIHTSESLGSKMNPIILKCENSKNRSCGFNDIQMQVRGLPSYADTNLALNYLEKVLDSTEPLVKATTEELEKFHQTQNKFSSILSDGKLSSEDNDNFSNFMEFLKSFDLGILESLESYLGSFSPVAEITKMMLELYEDDKPKTIYLNDTFASRFGLYSGMENDIASFKQMTDTLNSTYQFPSRFSEVPINSRSKLTQRLAATLHQFIELSNGLLVVDKIANLSSSIRLLIQKPPSDIQNRVLSLTGDIDGSTAVSEANDIFSEFLERIEFSGGVVDEFQQLNSFLSDSSKKEEFKKFSKDLTEMINACKDYFWPSKILTILAYTEKSGLSEAERIKKLSSAVHEGATLMSPLLEEMRKLKDDSEFYSENVLKWKNREIKYTKEQYFDLPATWKSVGETVKNGIIKFQDIKSNLSAFDSLKQFEDINKDQDLIGTTQKLLKLAANSTVIGFGKNENSSERMSQLISGATIGSDILDSLHFGLPRYRALVKGVMYTKSLKPYIVQLEKDEPAFGKKIRSLLKGMNKLEVVTDYYHHDPLEYLETLSPMIKRLKRAVVWVNKIGKKERSQVLQDLQLLKDGPHKSKNREAVQELHRFVSRLDNDLAFGLGNITKGLEKFWNSLTDGKKPKGKFSHEVEIPQKSGQPEVVQKKVTRGGKVCPKVERREISFIDQLKKRKYLHLTLLILTILAIYAYVVAYRILKSEFFDSNDSRPPPRRLPNRSNDQPGFFKNVWMFLGEVVAEKFRNGLRKIGLGNRDQNSSNIPKKTISTLTSGNEKESVEHHYVADLKELERRSSKSPELMMQDEGLYMEKPENSVSRANELAAVETIESSKKVANCIGEKAGILEHASNKLKVVEKAAEVVEKPKKDVEGGLNLPRTQLDRQSSVIKNGKVILKNDTSEMTKHHKGSRSTIGLVNQKSGYIPEACGIDSRKIQNELIWNLKDLIVQINVAKEAINKEAEGGVKTDWLIEMRNGIKCY